VASNALAGARRLSSSGALTSTFRHVIAATCARPVLPAAKRDMTTTPCIANTAAQRSDGGWLAITPISLIEVRAAKNARRMTAATRECVPCCSSYGSPG
jgi:hypothetical protein